jgi:signal peptidase
VRVARRLGNLAFLLACVLLAAVLAPTLLGYERYVLVGRSMEPAIDRGSLVYDEVVPTGQLRVGDVITYVQPATQTPTTHRIVRAERDAAGRRVFVTKGDNNAAEDLHPFTLDQPKQARVAFSIPYAGHLFILLADPRARLWLLAVPALLIALAALARMWRDAGVLLEQQG